MPLDVGHRSRRRRKLFYRCHLIRDRERRRECFRRARRFCREIEEE